MRPVPLAAVGLVLGLAFPAVGALLGAAGPLLALLAVVPVLVAGMAWLVGRQAEVLDDSRDDLRRAARTRREELERAAAELTQRSRALVSTVAALTTSTEESAAGLRDTSTTMTTLSSTATATALTAETVVGLSLESERAAERGLTTAEQSREALSRLAREVQDLSELVRRLDARMREVLPVADEVARVAERSRSLSAMARAQADGGVLAPEAFPALLARLDGHAEDAAVAAARVRAILDEVLGAMAGAVASAEAGSVRAGEGAMVIEGAAGTLRELSRALRESAAAGRGVAGVAQQQQAGFDQVLHGMNGIFLATERAAASTRLVAQEARAVGELAQRLRKAVAPDRTPPES